MIAIIQWHVSNNVLPNARIEYETQLFFHIHYVTSFCAIFSISQGVDCTEEREVATKIPISEIPFIMRALGFYPTEQEVRRVDWLISNI